MYIRHKLVRILTRINYFGENLPKTHDSYREGFLHALSLVKTAMRVELLDFTQESYNRNLEIRSLKEEILKLEKKVAAQKNYASQLEGTLNSPLPAPTQADLSKTKVKMVCRVIAAMTGQPYTYVKREFDGFLRGEKRLHPSDFV